jgi:methyltransferase family protein
MGQPRWLLSIAIQASPGSISCCAELSGRTPCSERLHARHFLTQTRTMKQLLKDLVAPRLPASTIDWRIDLQMEALYATMKRHGWSQDSLGMTDEQAVVHFANDTELGQFACLAHRLFHKFKLEFLSRTLGAEYIASRTFLEVGDSDGLVLKSLGKSGFSINNDPRCIDLIRRNGIEATVGVGEGLGVPDKSYDVAMAFETLEHSLNPLAFLQEMTRAAREKIAISIPGVSRTFVHPRVKGIRVGEEHVFEFCSRDLLNLVTHLPLRLAHFRKFSVFAPPPNPLALAYYYLARDPQFFGGCFRWFDFYIFDVMEADQGRTRAESNAVYRNRR